jgi:hypothetical protein
MPVKIFHIDNAERKDKLLDLESEINRFEQQVCSEGMQISNITSSVTYSGELVVIIHYGNKSES